jgi:hypothetical protein
MNDDMMFEYLLQMGAMSPEEEELRRKQAQVEALRQKGQEGLQGQMVGKHYVGPTVLDAGAKLATMYQADKQQKGVDTQMRGMNDKQRQMLEDLRRRRGMGGAGAMPAAGPADPYGNLPTYGSVT